MAMMRCHDGSRVAGEDLRIPADVRRCVHMVAAHEVRGSFPVDLVDGANCEQTIYPRMSRIRGCV